MPNRPFPLTEFDTAGIDGCRAGWVVIALRADGQWEGGLYPDLTRLWQRFGACGRLFIDIPIGLPEEEAWRTCDLEARSLLGPRRSSIFPPPVRAAAYADTYREACALNAERTGKKISIQTWNITPKIRETDRFLTAHPKAAQRLLEAHPEVNFRALSGLPMIFNKKKEEGFRERMEVLQAHCPQAEAIVTALLERYRRGEVARDDIVDALCLAVHARRSLSQGLRRLPAEPPRDGLGRTMQIVMSGEGALS